MIIERGFEALNELGTEKVGLDGLIDRAYEMEDHWRDDFVTANCVVPVSVTNHQASLEA